MNVHDIAIIGGGPAGMAAGLVAGRARLRTVIINAEAPRNAVTKASHGYLTRDGVHPTELLDAAKSDLARYASVRYRVGRVTSVTRVDDAFELTLGNEGAATDAPLLARRVVIASGYRDDLSKLSLTGVEEVYGRSVFPCPFCDGFEHADERLAVFMSDGAQHFAAVVGMWSDDLVVFTNGKLLDEDAKAALDAAGVPFHESPVRRLHATDGRLTEVELTSGERIPPDAGFIGETFATPSTPFADELGIPTKRNAWGEEVHDVDEGGASTVEGVYLVGDARSGFGGLQAAAHDGSTCAAHIVHAIAKERFAAAERAR